MKHYIDRAIPDSYTLVQSGSPVTFAPGRGLDNLNRLNVRRNTSAPSFTNAGGTLTATFSGPTVVNAVLFCNVSSQITNIVGESPSSSRTTIETTSSGHRNILVEYFGVSFPSTWSFTITSSGSLSIGYVFFATGESFGPEVNPDYGLNIVTEEPSVGGRLPNGQSWNNLVGERFDILNGQWTTLVPEDRYRNFLAGVRRPSITWFEGATAPMLTQDYDLRYNQRIQSFGQHVRPFALKEIV